MDSLEHPGGKGLLEPLFLKAWRASPALLVILIAVLTVSTFYGVVRPLYVVEGAVSGSVYGYRAEIVYAGTSWVPGPLAASIALYIVGTLVQLAGLASIIWGFAVGDREYVRVGGYLAVVGYSAVISAKTLIGQSLEPFERNYVFETNLGVIDMGSARILAGEGSILISTIKRIWPIVALLILILAELTSYSPGGESGYPRNNWGA